MADNESNVRGSLNYGLPLVGWMSYQGLGVS